MQVRRRPSDDGLRPQPERRGAEGAAGAEGVRRRFCLCLPMERGPSPADVHDLSGHQLQFKRTAQNCTEPHSGGSCRESGSAALSLLCGAERASILAL